MRRKILSLAQVSERTLIPLSTLRYLRYTGRNMPTTWKLNGRVVAYEDDVEAWLDEQYASTSSAPDKLPAA